MHAELVEAFSTSSELKGLEAACREVSRTVEASRSIFQTDSSACRIARALIRLRCRPPAVNDRDIAQAAPTTFFS